MAGMAVGTCRIKGLLSSDDTQVMMNALLQIGTTTIATTTTTTTTTTAATTIV